MDGFIELKSVDYKGYETRLIDENHEPFSMYVHTPCGTVCVHKETHLRYCPAVIAVVSPSVMET